MKKIFLLLVSCIVFNNFLLKSQTSLWEPIGLFPTINNGFVDDIVKHGEYYYFAGDFTKAGNIDSANYIVRWNIKTKQFSTLGSGLNGRVYKLLNTPERLYVVGIFTDAGGHPNADYIAYWDYTQEKWFPMPNYIPSNFIYTINICGEKIIIGGTFVDLNGNPNADRIAYFNTQTQTWHSMGLGLNNIVENIAVSGRKIFVGGRFTTISGVPNSSYLAVWDTLTKTWSAVGQGVNDRIMAIEAINNEIFVAGNFTQVRDAISGNLNANRIAKWDTLSQRWYTLGSGIFEFTPVYDMKYYAGKLYVGGYFFNAGGNQNADILAVWDNTSNTWESLNLQFNNSIYSLHISNDTLIIGGSFSMVNNEKHHSRLLGYNLNKQKNFPIINVPDNSIYSLGILNNNVIVGGQFKNSFNIKANNIALWDTISKTWKSNVNIININGKINTITNIGKDFYIGGNFNDVDNIPTADFIVRWDTVTKSWSSLPIALNNEITTILAVGNDLYIGGKFTNPNGLTNSDYFFKYSTITGIASSLNTNFNGSVKAIAFDDSTLFIGGDFTNAFGNDSMDFIVGLDLRKNKFFTIGTGLNGPVNSICPTPYGLFIGGEFNSVNNNSLLSFLIRWEKNSNSYEPLSGYINGAVYTLLQSGSDLYVGGGFTEIDGNTNLKYLAKFDMETQNWLSFGTGANDTVFSLKKSQGYIYAAGKFTKIDETDLIKIAQFRGLPYFSSENNEFINICPNTNITINSNAFGIAPLFYKWYKNGILINNATNRDFHIINADTSHSGIYVCLAKNLKGSAFSNKFVVSVKESPQIQSNPQNVEVCSANPVSFSVQAKGTNLTYQWQYDVNGTFVNITNSPDFSGTNSSTLWINNPHYGMDNMRFRCIVSGVCAPNDTSDIALLKVKKNPIIIEQPLSSTVCYEDTIELSILATGSDLTYRWQINTGNGYQDLNNNPNSNILKLNASEINAQNAVFRCIVSGSCGSPVISNPAIINIQLPPVITINQNQITTCEGTSIQLNPIVNGSLPILYQWYHNNDIIQGAIYKNLLISYADQSSQGNYYLVAQNNCGITYSNPIELIVKPTVQILSQPNNINTCVGQQVVFSVNAIGTNLNYQWQKKTGNIFSNLTDDAIYNGVNTSSLTITNVPISMDGNVYRCIITGECGSPISSTPVILTVSTKPSISILQNYYLTCEGNSLEINSTINGSLPIQNKWYKIGYSDIISDNQSLYFSSINLSDSGTYYLVSTNNCGSDTSNHLTIDIKEKVKITGQLHQLIVCSNSNSELFINYSGSEPVNFQWYFNNTALPNTNNNKLIINDIQTSQQGNYYAILNNVCNTLISDTINVSVIETVNIEEIQNNIQLCIGENIQLNPQVSGSQILTYEWIKDGVFLSNNSQLEINGVNQMHAGNYIFVVSNMCNHDTSNVINIKVFEPVSVSNENPSLLNVCQGNTISLNISVTGTQPIINWYKNNSLIVGENDTLLLISEAQSTHSGVYQAVVSNVCNTVTTLPTDVIVKVPPVLLNNLPDQSKCEGDDVEFTVDVVGQVESVIWQQSSDNNNWENISSNYSLFINDVDLNLNNKFFRAVILGACVDTIFSNSAQLIVNKKPIIILEDSIIACSNNLPILDAGNGYAAYLWNTGSTDHQLLVSNSGIYSVSVTTTEGCSSSSNQAVVNIKYPFNEEKICVVSYDPLTQKNKITFTATPNKNTAYVKIMRRENNSFVTIATLPWSANSQGFNEYVDLTSQPLIRAERYAISIVDSCGVESYRSPYHQSIYLNVIYEPALRIAKLYWTKYVVENDNTFPLKYYIYKGNNPYQLILFDSVAASLSYYEDINVTQNTYYRIVLSNNCNINEILGSNISCINITSIDETNNQSNSVRLFPNPLTELSWLEFETIPEKIIITDLIGQVVLEMKNITKNKITLKRSDFTPGIYFVELYGEKSKKIILLVN